MSIQVLKVTELNPRLGMEVLDLLTKEDLISHWLPDSELFVRLDSHGSLEGVVCFKDFDEDSLVLFVAVREDMRGEGAGSTLINHILSYCAPRRDRIYLLADRALDFFRRFGFSDIPPEGLPESIRESSEVKELISPGIVAMVLNLPGRFSMV